MSFNRMLRFLACTLLAAAALFPAFPIGGIGIHYGIDLSLSMSNTLKEQASLGDLRLDTTFFGGIRPVPPGTKPYLSGSDLPVYIERTNWERNWFNLGGKLFVDFIPFVSAVELSVNYGMWEYQGKIIYPTSIAFTPTANQFSVLYDTTMITSEALGLGNPFVTNTPYAKLQFDLTARKNLATFPPVVKIFKLYTGTGMSLIFATPVLSAGFIEKTIGNALAAVHDVGRLPLDLFGQKNDAMVKIGKQFIKELMTPHFGMHLDLGAAIKLPVMPVGVYIDGKYLIPFGKMDKNVPSLKANGILLNIGIMYAM